MQPLIVCDSARTAGAALLALRAEGWNLVQSAPDEPWSLSDERLVYHGDADTAGVLEEGLVAAVRGAAVVLVAPRDDTAAARLVEDLSRLGRVQLVGDGDPAAVVLTPDQRRLLDLLAHGSSVAEAAHRLSLSRRTAHRRLEDARAALGAGSTAEAVALSRDRAAQ